MTGLFGLTERRRNARWLLAAAFLSVAFIDLGSHALTISTDGNAWCTPFHSRNSGIDCPHKRDHRTPEKNTFDETTLLTLEADVDPREPVSIVYQGELPVGPNVRLVTRSLDPPFQPPKLS